MYSTRKSSLLDKVGRLVGFGHGSREPGRFIEFNFYEVDRSIVLCLSEGAGKYDVEQQRSALGAEVPAALFAPYAVRQIEGGAYRELRGSVLGEVESLLRTGVPDAQFEWLEEN